NNIIPQWGSLAALRSDHGKYVTFEHSGQVTAYRDQPGQTEQFHVTISGLSGDINQYQRAPQVNVNVQPQGFGMQFGMQTQPTYGYQQPIQQPIQQQYQQPVQVQTTTYVQSG